MIKAILLGLTLLFGVELFNSPVFATDQNQKNQVILRLRQNQRVERVVRHGFVVEQVVEYRRVVRRGRLVVQRVVVSERIVQRDNARFEFRIR